jgi:succinate dehydrogenase / fumarate reductase flavoprotein subunit
MLAPFESGDGESPYQVHRDLQETMHSNIGIFRNEEDLKKGLEDIQKLKARASCVRVEGSRLFNPGWHLARDLRSMLTVSEAIALSALERKESRGAHARIDYTGYDDRWARLNNCVRRAGDEMQLTQTPIPEMPAELRQILDEDRT